VPVPEPCRANLRRQSASVNFFPRGPLTAALRRQSIATAIPPRKRGTSARFCGSFHRHVRIGAEKDNDEGAAPRAGRRLRDRFTRQSPTLRNGQALNAPTTILQSRQTVLKDFAVSLTMCSHSLAFVWPGCRNVVCISTWREEIDDREEEGPREELDRRRRQAHVAATTKRGMSLRSIRYPLQ